MAEYVGAAAGESNLDRASAEGGVDGARAVYALGSSSGESARLQRQANELAPDSAVLLDRAGLRPGDSAIDMGCGPRGILDLMCERVSPGGRVVGLDADPVHIAMASEFVDRERLAGVELVCADARHTGLMPDSFDLVHARTLLINVPDPSTVMAEMVRLVRPAGWVAGLEPDTEHGICYPSHPAFDRLSELFTAASRATAPIHTSGGGWRSSIARQGWRTLRWTPGSASTPSVTRAGRSAPTWSAACEHTSWRWSWPTSVNSMSSTGRHATISPTPTPS